MRQTPGGGLRDGAPGGSSCQGHAGGNAETGVVPAWR